VYLSKYEYFVGTSFVYFVRHRVLRTVLRDRGRRPVPEEADFDEEEHFVATVERKLYVVNTIYYFHIVLYLTKMSLLTWRSNGTVVRLPRQEMREFPGVDLREVLRGNSQEYNIPDTRNSSGMLYFLYCTYHVSILCN